MKYDYNKIIDRSKTNSEKYLLRKELFGTEDVLPMWVADMDIFTPPFVVEAIKKRANEPIYGYEEIPNSAFEAQIRWMKKRHNLNLKREWMLYSHSVVSTINVAIKAFSKVGDKIIVQTPVYYPFMRSVRFNNREILFNPLKKDEKGDYTFDFEDLKSKIDKDTKLLLLCSPHNPVGRVWKKEELLELATICLENDIKVLSDEIHSDLVYDPHKHIPFASLSKEISKITMTAIGPGKSFNLAGLSITTVAIEDDMMRDVFDKVHRSIHFSHGSVFSHVGFEVAYKEGEEWLDGLLIHLKENVLSLYNLLQTSNKISMNLPEATYLAWLDCANMKLSDEKIKELFIKEAKLGLNPGYIFGKDEGRGFMRLNFGVSKVTMNEALKRLEKIL